MTSSPEDGPGADPDPTPDDVDRAASIGAAGARAEPEMTDTHPSRIAGARDGVAHDPDEALSQVASGPGPAQSSGDAQQSESPEPVEAPEPAPPVSGDEHRVVVAERDELRDTAMRLQAEFENFRKQTIKRQTETVSRATEGLVSELLPVLDAFDAALAHRDDDDIAALGASLWKVLESAGLERVAEPGAPFDPNRHEAVQHLAPVDGVEFDGPTVMEVLRAGYSFKGRTLRAAMVAVSG